jgi:hypothetical protein
VRDEPRHGVKEEVVAAVLLGEGVRRQLGQAVVTHDFASSFRPAFTPKGSPWLGPDCSPAV